MKLFSSLESNTQLLNLPGSDTADMERTSIDVFDENEDEILLTDIEDTEAAIDEGDMYANIMMETYSAISKEAVGSDSYKAVCSLSRNVINALPDRLNLKKHNSMPAIEDVSHNYDVYDSIAKESILENAKKVIMEIWKHIKELIAKKINSYKKLLLSLMEFRKEKQRKIKSEIEEIKRDKNKYTATDGEITVTTFSKVLDMHASDLSRQGNIVRLLINSKEKFKYTDINQLLTNLKTEKLTGYYTQLSNSAGLFNLSRINHNSKLNFLRTYDDLYEINHEFKYSTPLTLDSLVIINTKRFKDKIHSFSEFTDIVDKTRMVKFEDRSEDVVVNLSKNIDEIDDLNDTVMHIHTEVSKIFDKIIKVSSSLKKDVETISKEDKDNYDIADRQDPTKVDVPYLNEGIAFISKLKQITPKLQIEILKSVEDELIFTNKYVSQLERFILASLDTFKPAN